MYCYLTIRLKFGNMLCSWPLSKKDYYQAEVVYSVQDLGAAKHVLN